MMLYQYVEEKICTGMNIYYASMLVNFTLLILFIDFYIKSQSRKRKPKTSGAVVVDDTGANKTNKNDNNNAAAVKDDKQL
jgi:hypothetical protein